MQDEDLRCTELRIFRLNDPVNDAYEKALLEQYKEAYYTEGTFKGSVQFLSSDQVADELWEGVCKTIYDMAPVCSHLIVVWNERGEYTIEFVTSGFDLNGSYQNQRLFPIPFADMDGLVLDVLNEDQDNFKHHLAVALLSDKDIAKLLEFATPRNQQAMEFTEDQNDILDDTFIGHAECYLSVTTMPAKIKVSLGVRSRPNTELFVKSQPEIPLDLGKVFECEYLSQPHYAVIPLCDCSNGLTLVSKDDRDEAAEIDDRCLLSVSVTIDKFPKLKEVWDI